MRTENRSLILACGLALAGLPVGAAKSQPPPQTINLSKFPAKSVEDVVVPVPSEVFSVLDKLGSPNWRAELRPESQVNASSRSHVALLLGTVIADGFVAVEAEDPERVKEIGKEVLRLADAINVRKSVIARSKSITEKADARNWAAVRLEFDGALQDVRAGMRELNDDELAQLVSLGGWIRGTEALTSVVQKNFTPEGADLLHQPELVAYFDEQLDDMNPRLRSNALVGKVRKLLDELKPIVAKPGEKIDLAAVKKVNTRTRDVVNAITAQDKQ